jgi:hypothetical protein
MKNWMKIAIPIAVVAAFLAWYAFRPERLVVNRRVDEAMPAAQGNDAPKPLIAGQFLQHPAPYGGHSNHLPDERWYSCSSLYELQYIKWP